jgi:hypothetical protein
LPAGVLFCPKERSQRRGRPLVGARYAGSLCYSDFAGAAPLRQSLPFIREALRCSAPPKGPGEPGGLLRSTGKSGRFSGLTATGYGWGMAVVLRRLSVSPGEALGSAAGAGEVGSHCLSGPPCRVAQGNGRSPVPTWAWPSLLLLILGHPRKSAPARQAPNPAPQEYQPEQKKHQ